MFEIKNYPTPGYRYQVVSGDRLDTIEKRAYGSIKGILESANPFLANRPISLENRPTIYDDILFIPELPELREIKTEQAKVQLKNKDKNELTIVIDNKEIKYESAKIIRTMDTVSDGWSARIPWYPGQDQNLDSLLKPYTYPKAQVYIGNELIISGYLYRVSTDESNNGNSVELEGFSFTADAIDSTVPKPYESNNITLEQRANELLQYIGIRAVFDFDSGGKFDRVTAEKTDTIFQHLSGLAAQRGFLISCTPEGNMLFTRTNTGEQVGTLETGKSTLLGVSGNFDGREMFNSITAFGESPGNPIKNATVTDKAIPRSRFFAFDADDTTDGNIQNAASWKRSQLYAKAFENTLVCAGWYAPNGKLWKENTNVIVVSPALFASNGFKFLIKQVEYIAENGGLTTNLSVVPPTVYTGGEIVLPWSA